MELILEAVLFLAAAVVAVPIFRRVGLSDVLAYLAAGVVLGKSGANLVKDAEAVLHFAEIGVVFLLFIIGLELQPARLRAFRRLILGLGLGQVLFTGAAVALIAMLLGLAWPTALIVGCALSLSSTAFVLQLLAQRKEMMTPQGRAGFAVLLLQDIAVIPMLLMVAVMAGGTTDAFDREALIEVGEAIAVVVAFVVGAHYLLRPVLKFVASARVPEAFTAAALLLALGSGLLMESIGLSMGLGAFLAGVLVADSEYRHQLEADILPFRRLLLGLFFMAVGLSADLSLLVDQPIVIGGLTIGLIVLKAAVLYPLARVFGLASRYARSLALLLAQGGEFAFVLIAAALSENLVTPELAAMVVLIVTLSMAFTPLIYGWSCRGQEEEGRAFDEIEETGHRVIIAGFGRFGQIAARILSSKGIRFTALEVSSSQVDFVRRYGNKIYYGDAASHELLRSAGIETAKILVVAVNDPDDGVAITQLVAKTYPNIKILARARDRQHALMLQEAGAHLVIRETLHSGLELAKGVLRELDYSDEDAARIADMFAEHDMRTLENQFAVRHDETAMIQTAKEAAAELKFLFESDAKSRLE